MANRTGKGAFTKGDPRINRRGRPKDFFAFRELAQQIAHEAAITTAGAPLVINGHKVTIAEAILRDWAHSKNPQLQRGFIEVAYGKVPDAVQVTGEDGGPMIIKVEYVGDDSTIE